MATGQADTKQSLFAEYNAWCADNKLPHMPADELSSELDYARDLTDDACKIDKIAGQLQWLADFKKRWEKVASVAITPLHSA
jgi:hypothetical protein